MKAGTKPIISHSDINQILVLLFLVTLFNQRPRRILVEQNSGHRLLSIEWFGSCAWPNLYGLVADFT